MFLVFDPHTGRVGSTTPDKGVSDMITIPDIDETGVNRNLKVRYERDEIYVSISLYQGKILTPLAFSLI